MDDLSDDERAAFVMRLALCHEASHKQMFGRAWGGSDFKVGSDIVSLGYTPEGSMVLRIMNTDAPGQLANIVLAGGDMTRFMAAAAKLEARCLEVQRFRADIEAERGGEHG